MSADSHSIDDNGALIYLEPAVEDSTAGSLLEQDGVFPKEEDETDETQADKPKKNRSIIQSLNFEQTKGVLLSGDVNISKEESAYQSIICLNSSVRSLPIENEFKL